MRKAITEMDPFLFACFGVTLTCGTVLVVAGIGGQVAGFVACGVVGIVAVGVAVNEILRIKREPPGPPPYRPPDEGWW